MNREALDLWLDLVVQAHACGHVPKQVLIGAFDVRDELIKQWAQVGSLRANARYAIASQATSGRRNDLPTASTSRSLGRPVAAKWMHCTKLREKGVAASIDTLFEMRSKECMVCSRCAMQRWVGELDVENQPRRVRMYWAHQAPDYSWFCGPCTIGGATSHRWEPWSEDLLSTDGAS